MEEYGISLTPPKNDSSSIEWVTPDAGMYEAYVVDVVPVKNPFYGKDPEKPGTPYKLEWTFRIDDGELPPVDEFLAALPENNGLAPALAAGVEERKWGMNLKFYKTTTKLGAHPKNGLTKTLRAIDPDFDLEVGYEARDDGGLSAMKEAVIGRYVKVITEDSWNKAGDKRYLKVAGLAKSRKGKVDTATLLALKTGGSTTTVGGDLPPEFG